MKKPILLSFLIVVFAFVKCSKDSSTPTVPTGTTTYTVTFDVQGGNAITAITGVKSGSTITLPTPTRTGYNFVEWDTDAALTTKFDPATTITKDITLYAKWTAVPAQAVTNKTVTVPNYGFQYRVFYQATATATNRKGLIILAVGDGGKIDDRNLNDQCNALAQEGYVAVTTTYRNLDGGFGYDNTTDPDGKLRYNLQLVQFKQDILAVASSNQAEFSITISNTILGGLSRGANTVLALILPKDGDYNKDSDPITDIRGAVLQCAGGDEYKGGVLVPIAYMSDQIDNGFGANINFDKFKGSFDQNPNANIKQQSGFLISNSTGHCSGVSSYKAFIITKVKQWLP